MKKYSRSLVFLAMFLLAVSLASAEDVKVVSPNLQMIESGDKINIQVRGEQNFSGVFQVTDSGEITYPELGLIQVDQMTLDQLRQLLFQKLGSDYLVNPQISVSFEESLSKSVSVAGQVAKPGNYIVTPGLTLLKLVFQVSGLNLEPSKLYVKLIRKDSTGKASTAEIKLDDVVKGAAEDPLVMPGDLISVHLIPEIIEKEKQEKEKKKYAEYVTILGQVRSPGNYEPGEDASLIKVLGEAGGFTPSALTGSVKIVRRSQDGKETIFTVDAGKIMEGRAEDIKLQAGDLIVVPESFF